ncbi:MAG: methyl-accepting chemotaxis protein [Thermodesulfovibrionales bacterium]|nr:methyl-accepting chemotaxis protein [Thermodesulfovibrionales bacterium]
MNLTIGKKLTIGLAITLVMVTALGGIFYWSSKKVERIEKETMELANLNAFFSERTVDHLKWMDGISSGMFIKGEEFKGQLDPEKCNLGKWMGTFKPYSAELKEPFDKLDEPHRRLHASAEKIISKMKEGRKEDARKVFLEETVPSVASVQESLNRMKEIIKKDSGSTEAGMKAVINRANVIGVGFTAFLIIFCIIGGFFFVRGISKGITSPIDDMLKTVKELETGNLTAEITAKGSHEINQIADGFNRVVRSLRDMIKQTADSTYHVALSAENVSTGSVHIANSSQEEAAATDETTASMEEMAVSISQVSKNAEALATNVDETSATINEMAASIEQVGKNADIMAASVEETSATIEQMLSSIDQTARNTGAMTDSVNETSLTVENLLASVEQISKNTESLKHMVTETSSTIEEMMRTVSEVAGKIGTANKLSQDAFKDAEDGGKAIYQSIESLQNIGNTTEKTMSLIQNLGKRSEEIGSIVEVIDEIADQTNLLALNAAIEAARAGDAGRGFAVVAEEIRKLAERSMEATKEISSVIKQVQAETSNAVKATEETYREGKGGMALAASSRDAFTGIIAVVKDTSEIMNDIAKSAAELNKATGQVMKYIVDMNSSTEEVTGAVKAQAGSTGNIRNAIEKMNRQVQQVNIATKEQAIGGKQIRETVERMKTAVQEVGIAVKEQVGGARQIAQSVETMNTMTRDVANATAEQKLGGETIVKAMEGMSHIATENLKLSGEMKTTADDTLFQIENLQYIISNFRIHTNGNQKCWELLRCPDTARQKCPAYKSTEDRCWLITGTWCKGVQQGDARSKIKNCMTCEAFKVIQGLAV